jgi:hypothetical protein
MLPPSRAQLHAQYGLKEIIFVGDRGMITNAVAQKIKSKGPKVCTPNELQFPSEPPLSA